MMRHPIADIRIVNVRALPGLHIECVIEETGQMPRRILLDIEAAQQIAKAAQDALRMSVATSMEA